MMGTNRRKEKPKLVRFLLCCGLAIMIQFGGGGAAAPSCVAAATHPPISNCFITGLAVVLKTGIS
jgi:hypothetical protein